METAPGKRFLTEDFILRLPIGTDGIQASAVLEVRMVIAAVFAPRSRLIAVHADLMLHQLPVELQILFLTH